MKRREITKKLEEQAKTKKISIIVGPRQVGKTTILEYLHKKYGGFYLDLDILSNYEKLATYEKFIETLELNGYQKESKDFFYVFLDEFQKYGDLSNVLKNIYDHHSNIKIYATGSSALTIKNKIQESLAGRKRMNYLYPLSFREFLHFKEKDGLLEQLDNLAKLKQSSTYSTSIPEIFKLLDEFMIYGGYPELVLSSGAEEKKAVLEDIFDMYVKKDLVDYLQVEKIRNVKLLIEQIAVNHGKIANYNSFATIAEISAPTVKNYIEILSESYLVTELRPFFKNKNKEISKAPKLYFLDNGVRNFFVNNFNPKEIRSDWGMLFESYCMGELLKSGLKRDELKYYKTKNKVEVDIIVDLVSRQIPIEIKYSKKLKSEYYSGLKNFTNEYSPEKSFLLNITDIDLKGQTKLISPFDPLSKLGI